jgi:Domain of Unknown Function with PDB structure (DUF3857)/Transglutaminase-like superfamily
MSVPSFRPSGALWHVVQISLLVAAPILGLSAPPAWLTKASQVPTPSYVGNASAVVLLDEEMCTLDAKGNQTTEHHVALRLLDPTGTINAQCNIDYLDQKDRIRDSGVWLLRNDKLVKPHDDRDWVDVSAETSGSLYNEYRSRALSYSDLAAPGDVFGYSYVVTGRMLFGQQRFDWGHSLPVVRQTFSLRLPPGWALTALMKGQARPASLVSADQLNHTWEIDGIPYCPAETWTAPDERMYGSLLLTIQAPPGAQAVPASFTKWSEVNDFQSQMLSSQCDSNAALTELVAKLTAGCPDNVAKIRALCIYVQKLRYVAINRDLRRGFGYRPHKATETLAKGFGDCKDKSNLLGALLRDASIRSYPAIAQSDDDGDGEVFPDWPSPYQFNHMILAIEVEAGTNLPAVVHTDKWGSLLFFDPTNEETEVGDIPWYLQGTNVLLLSSGSDALVPLPDLPVETDQRDMTVLKLNLNENGSITGSAVMTGQGQKGAELRRAVHHMNVQELHDLIMKGIGQDVQGAVAQKITPVLDKPDGQSEITFDFSAPGFMQPLAGGLAVIHLNQLIHNRLPAQFTEKERHGSILTRPNFSVDEVTCTLPPAYRVEELPRKASLQTPYGTYERTYEVKDNQIIARRTFRMNKVLVSSSDYANFRKFLADVAKADRNAVVLRRASAS